MILGWASEYVPRVDFAGERSIKFDAVGDARRGGGAEIDLLCAQPCWSQRQSIRIKRVMEMGEKEVGTVIEGIKVMRSVRDSWR